MNRHRLFVLLDGRLVGQLWLNKNGLFSFQYDRSWLENPLVCFSLSLPLQEGEFADDEAHPFFANLLPDGELREAVARRLRVSEENDYGILEKIGGDCAGAVSVLPENSIEQAGYYEPKTKAQLKKLIEELPKRPLLAGESGIRLSLAGAQKKLPVFFNGATFCLPHGAPSTHIIKPQMTHLDDAVVNEAFCMTLAGKAGLPVPSCFIQTVGEVSFFVVERYDRVIEDDTVYRLHQEDFCQALKVPPRFKYEGEGGPSFKQCYDTIRAYSGSPAQDALLLLKWLVFNYLIGNCDNHAKNISLLHLPGRPPQLAPFYDLLSTRTYPELAGSLAMAIGGETDPDKVQERHWRLLAEELAVKPQLIFDLIRGLGSTIRQMTIGLRKVEFKKYDCDLLLRVVQTINLRIDSTLKKIA
ncbi:kinase [Geomonas sp. Red276]